MNPDLLWRTAAGCRDNTCVAVAATPAGVHVTNNSRPGGPVFTFTAAEWADFVAGVKAGEFDLAGHAEVVQ